MKKLAIFLVLLAASAQVHGQKVTKVGTTAARFLAIDIGARAVGMGGAYTTIAGDPSAVYWNPAGLAGFQGGQVLFNHAKWLADINIDFAAVAIPLQKWGTLGLAGTFLTMDAMEVTTVSQPMGTGEKFDAGSYAFAVSYANRLTDRFSIGGNVKFIHENIYHSDANGMAFDVGTLFQSPFMGIVIGASISNYGTKMQMSGRDMLVQSDVNPQISGNNENINAHLQTDAYDLPLMFRLGVGVDLLKGASRNSLILAVDALHPNDDTESLNLGAEYGFNRMVFLRAGYKSLFAKDSELGLSCGAGVRFRIAGASDLSVDYAYQDFGVLKNIQMFALSLGF
jgi:long-subunit fatty acid transport protein